MLICKGFPVGQGFSPEFPAQFFLPSSVWILCPLSALPASQQLECPETPGAILPSLPPDHTPQLPTPTCCHCCHSSVKSPGFLSFPVKCPFWFFLGTSSVVLWMFPCIYFSWWFLILCVCVCYFLCWCVVESWIILVFWPVCLFTIHNQSKGYKILLDHTFNGLYSLRVHIALVKMTTLKTDKLIFMMLHC